MAIDDRPMFTIDEVAKLAGTGTRIVDELCASYGIPTTKGMVSVQGLVMFFRALHAYCQPAIFDRLHLLIWVFGLENDVKREPPPFDKRIEQEIHRISQLLEPDRTIRAVELLERFVDVDRIADHPKLGKFSSKLRGIAHV